MGQFEDIFMKMHQKLLILQGTDTGRWEPLGQKGWQGKNYKIQVKNLKKRMTKQGK